MKKGMTYGVGTSRFGGAAFTDDGGRRPTVAGDAAEDTGSESMVSEAVAKHMLALVEVLVPRVVSETLAALQRVEVRADRRRETQRAARLSDKKLNSTQIADALGCGVWVVSAVKKANRIAAERGEEPHLFTGRYSSPERVGKWIDDHPQFIARRVLVSEERELKYRMAEFTRRRDRRKAKEGALATRQDVQSRQAGGSS